MGCGPCEAARLRALQGAKQGNVAEVVGGLTDGAKVIIGKVFNTAPSGPSTTVVVDTTPAAAPAPPAPETKP
jgi:hypothetical protein